MIYAAEGGIARADPGLFLGSGASLLQHHIVFFGEYQLYKKAAGHFKGGGGAHPLHPPPRSAPV